MTPAHHPVILQVPRTTVVCDAGFLVDALVPVRIRAAFERGMHPDFTPPAERRVEVPPLPAFNDEYLEWVALAEAVATARDRFVFFELGAGYGRWLVRAIHLARLLRDLPSAVVALEPDPEHYRFLLQHCRDNGINPDGHECYWAAVTPHGGVVPLSLGRADAWYGQFSPRQHGLAPPDVRAKRRLRARAFLGRPPVLAEGIHWVPGIGLGDLLSGYERVDLIHMDIQSAEGRVVPAGIDVLTERVRRVCIGTHRGKIETVLRQSFRKAGWENLADYPAGSERDTPFGRFTFGDGVQVWRNRRLEET